jgi:hypothetical protein
MQTTKNAAGQPADAGIPHVSASQIALLIEVAALAMQYFRQNLAVDEAHRDYIESITSFERKHGRVTGRIDPENPDHAKIIKATKGQYEARQDALRKRYNIHRRLQTACRKAARVNADRALEAKQ